MTDFSGRIDNLYDKVETLMVKYARLREENRRMQEELDQLHKEKDLRDEHIQDLNHRINVLKTSKQLERSEEDNAEIRQKLNAYIREIDRCIALLNN
jgi:peptidoglycan hydrolase CwlO-like protein